jgi:peroxiredoxin
LKLDPQKQFLRYSENCFNFLTWSELTHNRRVLLVSITRRKSPFVANYVQHLNIWAQVYRQWGVDQVYLVSDDQRYNVLAVDTLSKQLPVIGDVSHEFVAELSAHCGLQHHAPEQLTRYWNYQVLINNGDIERVYHQPMDDLVKNLIHDTKDISLAKQIRPMEQFHLTPFFLKNSQWHTQKVLYYRLHPNTDLKNYLLTTAR